MRRVVVAIDPSGAASENDELADAIGIVVAGLGIDGRGYVLADRTCRLSPAAWGRRAVAAYHEFKADRIVAERNFGGAMVEHVIKTADENVPFAEVTASRGKAVRTLIAGLPPAVHFGLVYIDTILASKAFLGGAFFGVPKLPAPYDTFEWAVVSSFFLVHAVNLGKSNVASWLGSRK
jgi:hypothetical protein